MAERALPVRTKPSHAGFGFEYGAVMTSTMSPFFNSVRSGSNSLLIFTATHWLPMSVWIEYAKSSAVAPRGSAMIFDFGVNT